MLIGWAGLQECRCVADIAVVGAQQRPGRLSSSLGSGLARLALIGAEILPRLATLEAITLWPITLETVPL